MVQTHVRSRVSSGPQLLTAEEVIAILRIAEHAPRAPREALRNLVRSGQLECLRASPGRNGRMVFLRRHVEECLARWERWGRSGGRPAPAAGRPTGKPSTRSPSARAIN